MTTRLLPLRSGLLVALLLFLQPLQLWAQSSVGSIRPNAALSRAPEYQVEPLGWAARVRFESGALREIGTPPHVLALARSSDGGSVPASRLPSTPVAGWLTRAARRGPPPGAAAPAGRLPSPPVAGWLTGAASRELARLNLSAASAEPALLRVQQPGQRKRSWIGRHPGLFGTLVGFGGGFLIGYLPGDDGVFGEFTAGVHGWVLGGVGAGTGALVGAIVGAATK